MMVPEWIERAMESGHVGGILGWVVAALLIIWWNLGRPS